ncbi:MAG TPA: outer membrane beta-barrel protein [Spirochaetota bacterium]|nr:outer membrane beta-barrel protein [Spirochaetota bacterium]HOM38941.1 outer membrane beta-barrel protein [Spirochaetota bacterium]HPQ49199.1 outer membrane beta-barrel protein [Spirochaetota bacterium]
MKRVVYLLLILFTVNTFAVEIGLKAGYMKGVTDNFKDYSSLPAFGFDLGMSFMIVKVSGEVMYFSASHKDYSDLKIKDTALNINVALKVPFIGIYGGIGTGIHFVKAESPFGSSDTESKNGFNIFAGYELPLPLISPFLELRYVNVKDNLSHLMILAGINLGF